jgi:riboflavin biosynthesis pyrimidine reductase
MSRVDASPIIRVWPSADPEPLDDEALLAAYAPVEPRRPTVRVNFVASIDGAVTVEGYSAGLSSPSDRRVFDLLRVRSDAVMVGAGTLRHEGYGPLHLPPEHQEWRRAHGRPADPPLVVVSGRLDLDPAHPMLADAPIRPVVVTHAASPPDRRAALATVADVLVLGETAIDLAAAVAALAGRGVRELLCEGGPHLLGGLVAADAVDEMCLTIAPLLAGAGADRVAAGTGSPVRQMRLVQVLAAGDELLLRYSRSERNGDTP